MRVNRTLRIMAQVVAMVLSLTLWAGAETIVFLKWGGQPDQWKMPIMYYEMTHPGMKVEFIHLQGQNTDAVEKVTTMEIAGIAPDVIWADATVQRHLGPMGILEDLSVYLRKSGLDLEYYPMETRKTPLWYFPTLSLPYVMFLNEDGFNNAAIPYPGDGWSWQDFIDYGKKLTDLDDRFYGTAPLQDSLWSWLFSAGANILDPFTGEIDQVTLDTLQWMHDAIYQHGIAPPPGIAHQYSFETGQLQMKELASWAIRVYSQTWSFDWRIALVPEGPQGSVPFFHTNGLAVLKSSRNKEAAWKFVEWVASEEYQEMMIERNEIPSNLQIAWQYALPDLKDREVIFEAIAGGLGPPFVSENHAKAWYYFADQLKSFWRNEVPLSIVYESSRDAIIDIIKKAQ